LCPRQWGWEWTPWLGLQHLYLVGQLVLVCKMFVAIGCFGRSGLRSILQYKAMLWCKVFEGRSCRCNIAMLNEKVRPHTTSSKSTQPAACSSPLGHRGDRIAVSLTNITAPRWRWKPRRRHCKLIGAGVTRLVGIRTPTCTYHYHPLPPIDIPFPHEPHGLSRDHAKTI